MEPAGAVTPGEKAPLPAWVRWLVYVSGGFGLAMFAQVSFIVPLRARELGASFDVIGILAGAGALAPALLAVPLGAVVDRLGPKRAFVLGTGGATLLWAAYLLVTSYWWLLPLQLAIGCTFSLAWVASQTYVSGIGTIDERPRHMGRFSLFSNVGSMLGPILLGGAAQVAGYRFAFVVPAAYSALFLLLGLSLRETRAPGSGAHRHGSGLGSARELIAIRGMQAALLMTFARIWTVVIFNAYFPVFLVENGFEPGFAGTVIALTGLVASIMAPTVGAWARLGSPPMLTAAALGLGAIALVIAPHASTAIMALVPPLLIGISRGLSLPLLLTIVTSVAPPDKHGVALGLRDMLNQMAATVAPVAVGPMVTVLGMTLGFTTGGIVAGAILLTAAALHAADRTRDPAAQP